MKTRLLFILFSFIFFIGLYGCNSSRTTPEVKNNDSQAENKLVVSSYIPDAGKIYTYSLIAGDLKKEIKVNYEQIGSGKYKRVELLDNEYKISETYKIEGDSIGFIDYNAENYGSEGVSETIDKGSRIILKSVEPGSSWENKYIVKREINDVNFYNVDGKFTFEGYEKVNVLGKEMDTAVITGNEAFTDQANSIVERLNVKMWMVKDIGPVKYEIERINGENKYSSSFELISVSEKD